jgi:hypothetical protein
MTTDFAAAQRFYGDVIGWKTQDVSQPGAPYAVFQAGEAMVAGVMPFPLPEEAAASGAGPVWVGYIDTPAVDDFLGRILAEGGTVHRQPQDIPGIGRFAVVSDPHGAVFVLFTPAPGSQSPAAQGVPGHIGWHELMAGDLESDFAFYSKLFGWTVAQEISMGPMGVYRLFATGGGAPAGGMMTKPAQIARPLWRYCFQVQSVAAAVPKITAGGGQVVNAPHQVPDGQWLVQANDPQGAFFALVSKGA